MRWGMQPNKTAAETLRILKKNPLMKYFNTYITTLLL